MLIKYNRKTYKILGYYAGNIEDIELLENEDVKELNVQDCSQTDIRAYNEDGTVKNLGQQIKEKILILKDNEVIKDGVVVELNQAYEEDKIKLIQRKLETLEDTQKIEYDRENKKYRITEKNNEELYISGLIGDLEYNEQIINNRMGMYSSQIDPLFMELMQEYFKTIELPKELKEKFNEILEKKQAIKEELPKTTSDNFKQTLKDKLDIENLDNLDNLIVKEIENGKRKTK